MTDGSAATGAVAGVVSIVCGGGFAEMAVAGVSDQVCTGAVEVDVDSTGLVDSGWASWDVGVGSMDMMTV